MSHRYDTKHMQRHLAISKIFDLVKPSSEVLDIGCSTGFLSSQLKKEKHCTVFGIDSDRAAIKIASKRLDRAICADIETNGIKLPQKHFDYIIFADVLEHTKDPEAVIRKFKKFIKPNGYFLISLPNVAHPINRLNLLLGRWNYTECGILDKAHLRFFTYKTAKSMLEKAGLIVVEETKAGKFAIRKTFSTQFVFKCRLA